MSEQTASPTELVDPFNGQEPSRAEYDNWRTTGDLPERFKPADSADTATAQDSSEPHEGESEPHSEAEDKQEPPRQQHKKLTAEGRIAQIDAQIEKLWAADEPDVIKIGQLEATKDKIERGAGHKRETVPAPVAPPVPQQQGNRSKPSVEDKNQDGTPKYANYEEYVEALADWKAEEHIARLRQEQIQYAQQRELLASIEEGKAIYGAEFGNIADATAGVIGQDPNIPGLIKQRFSRSDVLPHLTFTIGSEEGGAEKFAQLAKSDPFRALDYIALTESLIRQELAKATPTGHTARNDKGQFAATETPAPPKTQAPKPPVPVNSGSARGAFDVNDPDATNAEEWARKRNEQQYGKR